MVNARAFLSHRARWVASQSHSDVLARQPQFPLPQPASPRAPLSTHRKAASHVRRHTATRTTTGITPYIGNESSALTSSTESRSGAAISGRRKCLVEFTRATFRQFSSALVLL